MWSTVHVGLRSWHAASPVLLPARVYHCLFSCELVRSLGRLHYSTTTRHDIMTSVAADGNPTRRLCVKEGCGRFSFELEPFCCRGCRKNKRHTKKCSRRNPEAVALEPVKDCPNCDRKVVAPHMHCCSVCRIMPGQHKTTCWARAEAAGRKFLDELD